MTGLLFLVFLGTMALSVPIAFTMGIAGLVVIVAADLADPLVVPQQIFAGLDSFPLGAIPCFILAAELMTGGKITDVLLRFAASLVGRARGGLGHTNIVALTLSTAQPLLNAAALGHKKFLTRPTLRGRQTSRSPGAATAGRSFLAFGSSARR